MIPRSFIAQLVSQCDLEDLMASYGIQLKRAGRNIKALCPFHSEKTPSFVVYPDNQSFYCFGCGAGGDAISFIMREENLDYPEAVRFLAKRCGLTVPEDGDDAAAKQKQAVLEANREAARFFHKCLHSPAGAAGLAYFKEKRQLSDNIITKYGLGYAPDSFHALLDHLKAKGFSEKDLLAANLVLRSKNGRLYDQFRNRVIFPIIDLRGNVVGFGGRVLDDSKPKYLNSSDTPVFKKSKNLFSMNFAKSAGKDVMILAEGYMDVIAIHAAGFHNVVATLGTAITEEQCRLLAKYVKQVVIAYDTDGPGQAATMRAINLLSEAGITARVLRMEDAKDPDEYIHRFGARRFALLVEGAGDVVAHRLSQLKESCDLHSTDGKIRYLKSAATLLASVKNPLEREVYSGIVAKESGTMPEVIKEQVDRLVRKNEASRQKSQWRQIEQGTAFRDRINPQKVQNLKAAAAEEGLIAYLFAHPDAYGTVEERLTAEDLVTDFNRKVYTSMCSLHREGEDVTLSTLSTLLSQPEIGAVSAMIAKNHEKTTSPAMLCDYIDILLSHKDKPDQTADPDSLEAYRQRLKAKKEN